MKDYELSKERIAELEKLHRSLRDKRQADGVKAVIAHIDRQYGVLYSVSGVTNPLHRLGFSYKKPTHVPGKQDPAQQQAFMIRSMRIQLSICSLKSKQNIRRPKRFISLLTMLDTIARVC